jgi:O-palmitoleoyl-L-serine hydrolase
LKVLSSNLEIKEDAAMDGWMQGGAWCNNARACRLTKGTGRGSSDHMDKQIPFTGIMSSSPAANPGEF